MSRLKKGLQASILETDEQKYVLVNDIDSRRVVVAEMFDVSYDDLVGMVERIITNAKQEKVSHENE